MDAAAPDCYGAAMEPIVDIVIEAEGWATLDLQDLAERAARATLRHLALPDAAEIALLATDDARITTLNADFRDTPAPTNVLSWPAEELAAAMPGGQPLAPEPEFPGEPPFLGDIALAFETCDREAAQADRLPGGSRDPSDHSWSVAFVGV